jgi:CubicO group peptidase (beta-lactamase class C family)
MLVEEGKLRLDDPVTKWAPELADPRVLKKADGPLDDTYPAPRAITIEDLFTHRAGLSYGFSATGPIAKAYDKALGDPLNNNTAPDAWMKALGTLPLLYAPGERLHYSVATDVLGFIVGRVENKSFREVLMERLFGPLGMPDTDFYIPKEKRGRLATVYRQDQQTGALNPLPFTMHDTPPAFCGGGGGLISTADDYLKFARMMMNKGEFEGRRYLKAETVALMCTNRLTPEQRAIPLLGAIPMWDGMGFGLGVSIIDHPEKLGFLGMGAEGAFGWPGAFGTWWQADPANDLIALYLIQNSTPLEPGAIATLAAGQRMGARAALPIFQRLVYDALT